MADAVNKTDVLDRIEEERMQWDSLLTEIGEERMEQPVLSDGWTVKDVIAHVSAWRQWSLERIDAVSKGEPLPSPAWSATYEDEDEINVWIYESNRDRPLNDVLNESQNTFARLRTIVQRLSDDDLSDPARFAWMDEEALGPAIKSGSYFSHLHEGHEPELREWLASNS